MSRPPRLAAWLLSVRIAPHDQDQVIGDLDEAFHDHVERRGRTRAALWYWCQTLALARGISVPTNAMAPDRRRFPADLPQLGASARFVLRDSWRALRVAPTTTAFALLVLTLAITAATVTFSVVDTVVLRQLPFDHSENLVVLASAPGSGTLQSVSSQEAQAWQGRLAALDSWAVVAEGSEVVPIGGEQVRIASARVDRGDTRWPGGTTRTCHTVLSTRVTAVVTATQRDAAAASCVLPAFVSSYTRVRRPVSLVVHSARIQPASSMRCNAGYNEPSSTRSTSSDASRMAVIRAYPCRRG